MEVSKDNFSSIYTIIEVLLDKGLPSKQPKIIINSMEICFDVGSKPFLWNIFDWMKYAQISQVDAKLKIQPEECFSLMKLRFKDSTLSSSYGALAILESKKNKKKLTC